MRDRVQLQHLQLCSWSSCTLHMLPVLEKSQTLDRIHLNEILQSFVFFIQVTCQSFNQLVTIVWPILNQSLATLLQGHIWKWCLVKLEHMQLCGWITGLHKLCHPTIRDGRTWSKFGARGEHGDGFLFSNLGALWFSENLIRYSLHVCLSEVKNSLFIGPESDHWLCLSVTHSLTHSLRNA